ncbi:MAG TPA: AAA family ATPase [Candidatus Moranbacteria bacterium]|nr:AAA family ATPase [Candidatus Moranbacteria bacterium]
MFLKKLEINGFKSFATKTTLDFLIDQKNHKTHGITAIVGPNGSGKSNVADAMRWVMGEQSMKNLRGKKSEDVIFAGSGKKARLGSARVTLYLDNSDKKIPLDFSEVAITRKVHRSGEGEYSINGSRVRLQDIVDLLAKAGVGKESYAIINQGMADAILNSTPLERRLLIEDAAGVKQYQIKKDRSIRKLDSTRENLTRVKGLVEEIQPHLRMLKRQSEKAAKGAEVSKKLKEKQTQLFTYLWNSFQNERGKLNEEKEEMGRLMMNVQREVDKLADEISREEKEEKGGLKLSELDRTGREMKNKLSQLERDLIITEGRIEIEKEKEKNREIIEEIKIRSIPVDLSYVRDNIEEIKRQQEELIRRINSAEKLEDLQDIKEFARVISQRLHDLKADIEKGKKEEKIDNQREIKTEKTEPEESKALIELKERSVKIREEIKRVEAEIKEIEEKIEKEIQLDREKRRNFFEVERKMRIKQDELNKLKDEFNDSKIALAKVEVREEDLKNEVKDELKINAEDLEKKIENINEAELEREISRLKIQFEQIGGIDPLIIDEYEETQKRFDFLSGESEDLEKAITSLREVIKEMEQKINKEFESAFSEINREFTKYFRIIFGGGNAHLAKIKVKSQRGRVKRTEGEKLEENLEEELEEKEKEEEEETGIDIFACPPGKKISSLAMLSGGERSLTSLALLFAVISHNPPPFSVLDEVEAALDEANSKRFGRIILELSSNTQFVIISHNRETMRQASLLYGVTMGEDGISKLLSVKLDQIGQGGRIIN